MSFDPYSEPASSLDDANLSEEDDDNDQPEADKVFTDNDNEEDETDAELDPTPSQSRQNENYSQSWQNKKLMEADLPSRQILDRATFMREVTLKLVDEYTRTRLRFSNKHLPTSLRAQYTGFS